MFGTKLHQKTYGLQFGLLRFFQVFLKNLQVRNLIFLSSFPALVSSVKALHGHSMPKLVLKFFCNAAIRLHHINNQHINIRVIILTRRKCQRFKPVLKSPMCNPMYQQQCQCTASYFQPQNSRTHCIRILTNHT